MDATLARQSKLARLLRLGAESLVVMNPDKRAVVGRQSRLRRRQAYGEADNVKRCPVVTRDAVGLEQIAESNLQANDPTIGHGDLGGGSDAARRLDVCEDPDWSGKSTQSFEPRQTFASPANIVGSLNLGKVDDVKSITRDRIDVGLEVPALKPVDPYDYRLSEVGERSA